MLLVAKVLLQAGMVALPVIDTFAPAIAKVEDGLDGNLAVPLKKGLWGVLRPVGLESMDKNLGFLFAGSDVGWTDFKDDVLILDVAVFAGPLNCFWFSKADSNGVGLFAGEERQDDAKRGENIAQLMVVLQAKVVGQWARLVGLPAEGVDLAKHVSWHHQLLANLG